MLSRAVCYERIRSTPYELLFPSKSINLERRRLSQARLSLSGRKLRQLDFLDSSYPTLALTRLAETLRNITSSSPNEDAVSVWQAFPRALYDCC